MNGSTWIDGAGRCDQGLAQYLAAVNALPTLVPSRSTEEIVLQLLEVKGCEQGA
jgi:hypothetical protein